MAAAARRHRTYELAGVWSAHQPLDCPSCRCRCGDFRRSGRRRGRGRGQQQSAEDRPCSRADARRTRKRSVPIWRLPWAGASEARPAHPGEGGRAESYRCGRPVRRPVLPARSGALRPRDRRWILGAGCSLQGSAQVRTREVRDPRRDVPRRPASPEKSGRNGLPHRASGLSSRVPGGTHGRSRPAIPRRQLGRRASDPDRAVVHSRASRQGRSVPTPRSSC